MPKIHRMRNREAISVKDMMAIEAVVQCLRTADVDPKEIDSVMGLCGLIAELMHTEGGHSYEDIGTLFVQLGLELKGEVIREVDPPRAF